MSEIKIPDSKVVHLDPEKERLIVTFNCVVKPDVRQKVQEQMLEEYKTGVLVLPPLCSACIVKADTDIELRFHEENSVVVNLKNTGVEENKDD